MTKTKIEVKRRELTAEAPEAQMAIALPAREVFTGGCSSGLISANVKVSASVRVGNLFCGC